MITFKDFHLLYLDKKISHVLWEGYYLYNFKTESWYSVDLGGSVLKKVRGKRATRILTDIVQKEIICTLSIDSDAEAL